MSFRIAIFWLVGMLLVGPAQAADEFEAIGPPGEFTFDPGSGRFTQQEFPVTCHVNAMRGSMRFERFGKSKQWIGGFRVTLITDAKSVSWGVAAKENKLPLIVAMALWENIEEESGKIIGGVQFQQKFTDTDVEIPFLLIWNQTGDVTGFVGSEGYKISAGGKPKKMWLNGVSSKGTAQYQLGRIGEPDKTCAPIS